MGFNNRELLEKAQEVIEKNMGELVNGQRDYTLRRVFQLLQTKMNSKQAEYMIEHLDHTSPNTYDKRNGSHFVQKALEAYNRLR